MNCLFLLALCLSRLNSCVKKLEKPVVENNVEMLLLANLLNVEMLFLGNLASVKTVLLVKYYYGITW
jgi:hypothetical protein